jgi:8-oxo-dGTP pyrophosphatase MutT (NUDIX family)
MANFSLGLLVNRLSEALDGPLPGWEAQVRMTSRDRVPISKESIMSSDSKQAGVLVLLYPLDDDVGIVFMRRTEYNGVHSGQISFPGGKREKEDFSSEDTAVRETHEELGIDGEDITIIGRLTDLYIPPSNFHVTPVVGYMVDQPEYIPDPVEVADVIEIRLSDLLNENNFKIQEIKVNDLRINAPTYQIGRHVIWGATAMMLSEFIQIVRSISSN